MKTITATVTLQFDSIGAASAFDQAQDVVASVQIHQNPRINGAMDEPEREANARLLANAYTSFDKAGRELGVDAAELAAQIDIAALIRLLRASATNQDSDRLFRQACASSLLAKMPVLANQPDK